MVRLLEHNLRQVEVDEPPHHYLAVHSVSETTMAWDGVSEVLDVECSLEATGEEATKGSN